MKHNEPWPFGHLKAEGASAAARQIAQADLRRYAGDPLVVRELRRYLLIRKVLDRPVTMDSAVVDQAWHAFILDTRRYTEFCTAVFGEYLHHTPAHYESDADFPGIYEELFGEPLPQLWRRPAEPEHYLDTNCA